MDDYASLSHTRWECKYHVVFGDVSGLVSGKRKGVLQTR